MASPRSSNVRTGNPVLYLDLQADQGQHCLKCLSPLGLWPGTVEEEVRAGVEGKMVRGSRQEVQGSPVHLPQYQARRGEAEEGRRLCLPSLLAGGWGKAVPAGTCITKAMNRPLGGALRAAARPWLISNLPLPPYHLIR